MATLRELKGRIGSVASSEKITGAMKMISSAKMHKAEQMLRQLVPFRSQIENIISNLLSADASFESPLLEARDVKKIAVCVWGSDDGLCGAYNVNVYKRLIGHIFELRSQYGQNVEIEVVAIGSKIAKACNKLAMQNIAVITYDNVNSKSDDESVRTFTYEMVDNFRQGVFDRVDLLYMNFKSVSRQIARIDRILPISQSMFDDVAAKASARPYIFEPDVNTIFNRVLPLFILSVMQEVFIENRASEQAARVMAMQSANDNAKKLLDSLQLEYNKLRQQSITTELLDIVGGQIR